MRGQEDDKTEGDDRNRTAQNKQTDVTSPLLPTHAYQSRRECWLLEATADIQDSQSTESYGRQIRVIQLVG